MHWVPAIRLKADQRFLWEGAYCSCTGFYEDGFARATVTERSPAHVKYGHLIEALEVGDQLALTPDTRVGIDEHAAPGAQVSL